MKIKKLKVLLRRRKGPFEAFCLQESAEGEVRGKNILSGRNIVTEQNAKNAIQMEFGESVEEIEYEVEDRQVLGELGNV